MLFILQKKRLRLALFWGLVFAVSCLSIIFWYCHTVDHSVAAKIRSAEDFDEISVPPAVDNLNGRLIEATLVAPKLVEELQVVSLPFLKGFSEPDRDRLLRHIETSAAWFVSRFNGKFFAYRRSVDFGRWANSKNGYISLSATSETKQNVEYRIRFGLDGQISDPILRQGDIVADNATNPVQLMGVDVDRRNQYDSTLIVKSTGASAEIFERSAVSERPVTKAAVAALNEEFRAVLASDTARARGFDPALMPAESIKMCGTEERLFDEAFKDNLYHFYGYLNPGQSGYIYLKAINIDGLSPVTIWPDSSDNIEYGGWSGDAHERFLYCLSFRFGDLFSSNLTVRLEVWFVPESGGPHRLLTSDVFQVCAGQD